MIARVSEPTWPAALLVAISVAGAPIHASAQADEHFQVWTALYFQGPVHGDLFVAGDVQYRAWDDLTPQAVVVRADKDHGGGSGRSHRGERPRRRRGRLACHRGGLFGDDDDNGDVAVTRARAAEVAAGRFRRDAMAAVARRHLDHLGIVASCRDLVFINIATDFMWLDETVARL